MKKNVNITKPHDSEDVASPFALHNIEVALYNDQLSRLCSSRALWPLAPNCCPRATRSSQYFHTNHMLGTLDFTGSELWAPFNFSYSTDFFKPQNFVLSACLILSDLSLIMYSVASAKTQSTGTLWAHCDGLQHLPKG